MNWEDFREFTDTTAVYPRSGTADAGEFAYAGLGLAGEVGEMWEAKTAEARFSELGDCFWYVARGLTALEKHGFNVEICTGDIGLYPNPALPALLIGNSTKKLLRDGMEPDLLSKLYDLYMSSYLTLVMEVETLALQHTDMNYSLPVLFDKTAYKLTKRKHDKTLHGSGDNR